jgi:Tfp pilus assembly protein PilV
MELEECINKGQEVKHVSWTGDMKPDCKNCDGYGKDAKLHGWECYVSKKYLIARRKAYEQIDRKEFTGF